MGPRGVTSFSTEVGSSSWTRVATFSRSYPSGQITGNATWVTGINNQGVVVGYCGFNYSGWFQAFRWDSTNGIRSLGLGAIAGYPYYAAEAINDAGAIAYDNWSFSGPPSKTYFI